MAVDTRCDFVPQVIPPHSYQPIFLSCDVSIYATRTFVAGGENYFLTVNANTMQTQIINSRCLICHYANLLDQPKNNFVRNLLEASSAPFPMINDGITHGSSHTRDVILTADMCPAQKHFEQRMFDRLLKSRLPRPIPVSIAMTGLWMQWHPKDFQWIKSLNDTHELDITWINHSQNHPYEPHVAPQNNFLLKPGVDFKSEVLNLEMGLIQNGVTPSVFFRFPGLVSEASQILKLREFSLMAVGSDAWLALGQSPQPGSIILVHGNGNEPRGIDLLLTFFNSRQFTEGLVGLAQSLLLP